MDTRLDWVLVFVVTCLVAVGLVAVYQAEPLPWSSGLTWRGVIRSFPVKQLLAAILGFGGLFLLVRLPSRRLRAVAYPAYALLLGVLLLLLFQPHGVRGARSWLKPGLDFGFQPSEFMKLALVLALAKYLRYHERMTRFGSLLWPLGMMAVPMGIVLVQPDLGTALLFVPIWIAMVYAAGARRRHLLLLGLLVALVSPLAYRYGLKDNQRRRLLAFLDPEKMAMHEGFQLIQSRNAIGAGGLFGRSEIDLEENPGVPVPEQHNDFIFSLVGERWGLAGTSIVLALYAAMFVRMFAQAARCLDPFGRLVIVGITTMLAVQAFLNIAITIGLAPITGLTLPFLSYGGSSLLVSLLSIGVVVSLSRQPSVTFCARDLAYGAAESLLPRVNS